MDWKAKVTNYVIGRAAETSTLRGIVSALLLVGGWTLTDMQLDQLVAAVVAISAFAKAVLLNVTARRAFGRGIPRGRPAAQVSRSATGRRTAILPKTSKICGKSGTFWGFPVAISQALNLIIPVRNADGR